MWVWAWFVGLGRVGYEEGVLHVAGRVLLGDEEGIEVPKTGINKAVSFSEHIRKYQYRNILLSSGHLNEALVKEDVSELSPHFVQRM